jgi:hypothetical protein
MSSASIESLFNNMLLLTLRGHVLDFPFLDLRRADCGAPEPGLAQLRLERRMLTATA